MTKPRKPWLLDEAMASGELIEYQRAVLGAEVEQGFVVGIGRKWILVHVLDRVRLNGYCAVRERDITRARPSTDRLRKRILKVNEACPVPVPGIDLDRTRDLLRAATDLERIVGLNTEYVDETIRYIGAAKKLGRHRFALRGVSRQAKWKATSKRNYRYSEVSRIDFGDEYLKALLAVLDDRSLPAGTGGPESVDD